MGLNENIKVGERKGAPATNCVHGKDYRLESHEYIKNHTEAHEFQPHLMFQK